MIATSYRYIVQRAGVRSGQAIVEGTRIGVHDVVAMIKGGFGGRGGGQFPEVDPSAGL
jgi:uncharacterized protein (DUF433 family)